MSALQNGNRAPVRVQSGLEVLAASGFEALRGQRIGLITNQTGVASNFEDAAALLVGSGAAELTALFAPEHGLLGTAQAGGKVADAWERRFQIPAYSLYGAAREPSDAQLESVDTLAFDIQPVGARYYTYLSTLKRCLEKASSSGRRFVVLDRPNPLGGLRAEGFPPFEERFRSFVSCAPVPIRHGLTIAEFARWVVRESGLEIDLETVEMTGWRRSMRFSETGLPWVAPSPNMPAPQTALAYLSTCLIEGTNASEGRGTTQPFELFGAPWADAYALCADLNGRGLAGVYFRPASFTPVFSKHAGELCEGAQLHITDPASFRSLRVGIEILAALRRQSPEFAFVGSGERKMLDLLLGTDAPRLALESGAEPGQVCAGWEERAAAQYADSRAVFLYD